MENTRCKYLRLGDRFNHLLPALPETIETIILGRAFNQEIPLQPHLAPDFVRATGKLSLRIDNPDYGYLIPSVELLDIYRKGKRGNLEDIFILNSLDGVSLKINSWGIGVLQIKKQVHWDIIFICNKFYLSYIYIYGNIHISKFPETYIIIIDDNFNNPLPNLPEKLLTLKIGDPNVPVQYAKFNQPLPKLPLSLNTLILGNKFNQTLNLVDNSNLWYLTLGDSFDNDLNMPLDPVFGTDLKIGNAYNRPLNLNSFRVLYLEIGDSFNSNFIGQNLLNLNTLIIGNSYNMDYNFNNIFLLKHLLLGDSYNNPINKRLGLDTLILGNSFDSDINTSKPPDYLSVSNPTYKDYHDLIMKSKDPNYVYNHINTYFKDFKISCEKNGTLHINEDSHVLPSKIFEKMPIHTIQFNNFPYITSIPFNIKNIIINTVENNNWGNFNPNFFYLDHIEKFVVKQYGSFEKLLFPRKLRELEIHCSIELSESYPDTLTKISFIGDFNNQIEILPPNLEELIIGDEFDQDLPEFPETLLTLIIGNSFNRRLPDLPENIVTVKIGDAFDQPISGYPVAGGRLELGKSFNQILPEFDRIPNGLFDIIVHNQEYSHPLPDKQNSI
jgi:hypothetical protein